MSARGNSCTPLFPTRVLIYPLQDPNTQNALKTCQCRPSPDWSQALGPLERKDTNAHQKILGSLPNIVYGAPTGPEMPTHDPQYPKCDTTQISKVRSAAFRKGTYDAFCNTVKSSDKKKPFTQTVDIHGTAVNFKRSLNPFRRSPPVSVDEYKHYKFQLSWTGGDNSCPSDCADTFYSASQTACGSTGGDQDIMAQTAAVDTGCGTYAWKVIKPGTKPEWTQGCTDTSVYSKFTLDQATTAIKDFCATDVVLPSAAQPVKKTYLLKSVNLQLLMQWSSSGQDGCAVAAPGTPIGQPISAQDCSSGFLNAVNFCESPKNCAYVK